ncbi:MAG: hypothetical protein J0H08_13595 [Rhizobiales bacterium]|nr:hypothetical protein [Hyphomicrobiales bacterium]
MRALLRVIAAALALWVVPALAEPLELEVVAALAAFDSTGAAVVNVRLNPESQRAFDAFTTANVGRTIEVRVDGRVVSAPVIRDPITGGELVISGSLTVEEAGDLAMLLRDGALIEVEIVED